MLSVAGLNHFYYVRDFTDMRCKHSRVLSIIRIESRSGDGIRSNMGLLSAV